MTKIVREISTGDQLETVLIPSISVGNYVVSYNAAQLWGVIFDAAEKAGDSIRIGDFRCAPVQKGQLTSSTVWLVMEYGADFPYVDALDTRESAVNFMVKKFEERTIANARVFWQEEVKALTSIDGRSGFADALG